MGDPSELTPHAKAARVTYLLMQRGRMTTRELSEVTGMSGNGVRYLMENLSLAGVPVWKPRHGEWALLGQTGLEEELC